MNTKTIVEGVVFDPIHKVRIPGRLIVENGIIIEIQQDENVTKPFILPGFVDSHIHIESSMLTPLAFSKVAKRHGTVAVVADPHEIANVGGVEGINFMINNSTTAEIKFFFGAPSCVPTGPFDDCNAILDSSEIESLLQRNDIYFLGEMMNFPGIINNDSDVLKKIDAAKRNKKAIDGHAPGLKDSDLIKYIGSGITTDHECFTLSEAQEKIRQGMKVLIREGSAAKNFESLHSLIKTHTDSTMLCTDDCHPEDLMLGHINKLVKRAIKLGHDVFDVLQVVSVNPVKHYSLNIGLLQKGDSADFIVVDSIDNLTVLANFIKGIDIIKSEDISQNLKSDKLEYTFPSGFDFNQMKVIPKSNSIRAIQVIEGELVTDSTIFNFQSKNQNVEADINQDFLKVVVVNRYKDNEIGVGFIKGFGLKKGAIAESIAHDSHHIVAVGVDDLSIYSAIDFVITSKGGLSYFDGTNLFGMALPIYGLISDEPAVVVAQKYRSINNRVIENGCLLKAPFMTLSFMALSVIPTLKITPKGLFDVNQFKFVDLFIMEGREHLKDKIELIPEKPGVYQFYSKENELLYVGKAKKLRKRVQSYFFQNDTHSRKVRVLVSKICDIKYVLVDTESDALLLENNLIKKFQPRYNILLKDDKTYPWICIKNESFPRIISTRQYINDGSIYYGPYTSGLLVKTILDLIRKLYPIRTCSLNLEPKNIIQNKYKPCLEYQIGNCLAPCIGNQEKPDYDHSISEIQNILKGNLSTAQTWLISSMKKASKEFKFEQAQLFKSKLDILKKYQSKSTIVSNKVTNIDVFNILDKPSYAVVNFLKVVRGSVIQTYTLELKKNLEEGKEELLGLAITEIRARVSSTERNIVVPFEPDFLIEGLNYSIPKQGDKMKLLDLSLRNCMAHSFEIEKRIEAQNPMDKTVKVLTSIKDDLNMNELPIHIECFDNSNLQGSNAVSSCVVFRNAKPSKRDYRHFNVKTVVGANDFATMAEIVYRRYRRLIDENQALPQLVVIDGGKGQLSSAADSLAKLNILENIKLIGIAKRLEEIYTLGDAVPLYLDKNSITLKVIQNLRNEAHRFGIKHHKAKRSKTSIKSEFDNIAGIGDKTKQLLFNKFKSFENISKAESLELNELIGKSKADLILDYFKRK